MRRPGADNARMNPAREDTLHWTDDQGAQHPVRWRSLAGHAPPQRVQVVGDEISADEAMRLVRAGVGLLWSGDFQNARHLLQAMGRRVDEQAARGPGKRAAGDEKGGQARRKASRPGNSQTVNHAVSEAVSQAVSQAVSPAASQSASQSVSQSGKPPQAKAAGLNQTFLAQRQAQAQRARWLGLLLLPFDADHAVPLQRAPDVRKAGREAHGVVTEHYVASLRELLGVIGAHEWRVKGVAIEALQARIHPHHGVFSPVRGEYVDLVAQAPLPLAVARRAQQRLNASAAGRAGNARAVPAVSLAAAKLAATSTAPAGAAPGASAPAPAPAASAPSGPAPIAEPAEVFDIGCGTGVLAAVLAQRGAQVLATDNDPRALDCARDNLSRLKLQRQVQLLQADLFPPGRAGLVVCNPPWVPAQPHSALDAAVYDPDSRMLRGFLAGLTAHLAPQGEGWLILSDLAEHLGLRSRAELLGWIAAAGLQVAGRLDAKPLHARAGDAGDPLHAARAAEITSLWRLQALGARA